MRHAIMGLLAGIGLTAALAGWPAGAEPVDGYRGKGGDLITHAVRSETGPLTVIVIDAQARTMAVYHVQDGSGEIQLKSVRTITWDLQLSGYNDTTPLPKDIRKMLQSQ